MSSFYHQGNIKDFYTMTEIIIGRGSYAVVKLGFMNLSIQKSQPNESNELVKVGIKIYNKSSLNKKQKKNNLDNEIMALKK